MQQNHFSVVIICRNAAATIEQAIAASQQLTDDVVVVDNGSTDETVEKITRSGARLVQTAWMGYGPTKNLGNSLARYDWVLSLDADEYPDTAFGKALLQTTLNNSHIIYQVRRLNYLGRKPIHFGEWRKDQVSRVFNRTIARWDETAVHEQLLPPGLVTQLLPGTIHHFTAPDIAYYRRKMKQYALLMAAKYAARHKKAPWYKLYGAPLISFVQHYLVKAGFLDGWAGLQIAWANARYTYDKYRQLKQLAQTPA